MSQDQRYYLRVVYCDGGEFLTNARKTSDYMLEPLFLQYVLLCVVLFSALMLAIDLPFLAQTILFGAGVVSSFLWLGCAIGLNLFLIEKGLLKTVYTPLILLPMQLMNTLTVDYVLRHFGSSYAESFNGMWEIGLRTLIVTVCLDIIHGKYVAPQHSTYVDPSSLAEPPATPTRESSSATVPVVQQFTEASDVPAMAMPQKPDDQQNSDSDPVSPAPLSKTLTIARRSFNLASVQFIRSEDHYLVIQENDQSTMVRGKLRDITTEIDDYWGLQINRSIWVAYAAILAVEETAKGRLRILLRDGSFASISESRRVFFQHNYERYLATTRSKSDLT